MNAKVTMKDVAIAGHVSFATVSRALSGSSEIGEETRERILKLCEEMGYTPNIIARSMVMKRTNIIGLIVPSIDNPFMSEMAFHVELTGRRYGYCVMLCNSYPDLEKEKEVMKLLIGRQVDGILIIPQSPESCENIAQYSSQVPTVFLSENLRDLSENFVSVDNRMGTMLGTEYLYKLGHRKILYFGRRKSTTHQLRAEGYINACKRLGLEPRFYDSDHPRSSIETGYALAKELLSRKIDYSAIFASTDSNAIGIMQAADESGISIPKDLSLIGFDNIRNAGLPKIELTTIEQPKEEMAVHAVDLLHNMIEKQPKGYMHEILLPTLVERKSATKYSYK